MKILVFGAGGMIGHKMVEVLSQKYPDTYACTRSEFTRFSEFGLFSSDKFISGIDVSEWDHVENLLNKLKPDVILNCVGITLRKPEIKDFEYCVEVNSLFPQRLKSWAVQNSARMIHFSTDCVFDGKSENYFEYSQALAKDIYGKTKYLGEVLGPKCLTLRGSMIGFELFGKTELLEWAMAQQGKSVKGFTKAVYSGVTTSVMAELVLMLIGQESFLEGIYQVSSVPISKFDLLTKINAQFGLQMNIEPDDKYASSKVLNCQKIYDAVGFRAPSWDDMLKEMRLEKRR